MSLTPNTGKRPAIYTGGSRQRPRTDVDERPVAAQLPPFPRIRTNGTSSSGDQTSSSSSRAPSPVAPVSTSASAPPQYMEMTSDNLAELAKTLSKIANGEKVDDSLLTFGTYLVQIETKKIPLGLAYAANKVLTDFQFQLLISSESSVDPTVRDHVSKVIDQLKKL